MKLKFIGYVLLITSYVICQENPYILQGSLGTISKKKPDSSLGTLEIEDWVGQRFIFMPQSSGVQHFGYQIGNEPLPYSDWVGKIVTVTSVNDADIPEVTLMTEDSSTFEVNAYGKSIEDLCPLRDLDYAREKWLGKSLWLRTPTLTTYNDKTDEFGAINLGRTAHVKVTNIVAGWYNHMPIRFILTSDNGQQGLIDIQLTGTNVSDILRNEETFSENFDESNPKKKHPEWPSRVWVSISQEKIFVGMTKDQVTTSWGSPKKINRTTGSGQITEQWIYGDQSYVYLKNGIVTAIQN